MLDSLGQGVILWSPTGACEIANRRANEVIEAKETFIVPGTCREDMLNDAVARGLLSKESARKRSAEFASGEHFSFTSTMPSGRAILSDIRARKDGGHVVTLTDISAFHDTTVELEAALSMADVTRSALERISHEKAALEEKQEELQQLSLVAAHAKDLILISDATNRVIWANEAFLRHNGLDLEMDLMGRSGRDVLAGDDSDPNALQRIDEAVRNRQAAIVELICQKRSGAPYWMEQELIPVFNPRGEHTNFIMVGRDISERKAAEAAAREARRFEDEKRAESKLLSEFNEWLQSSDTLDEVFVVVSSFLNKLLPQSSGAIYTYGATRDLLEVACAWGETGVIPDIEPGDCWALRRGRSYFFGDNTVDIACNHMRLAEDGSAHHQYCLPIVAHGDTVGLLSIIVCHKPGPDTQKLVNFCAEHISLAIANVKLREQLREQSTRDPLTRLYNRRFFIDFATRELAKCLRNSQPATLITIDVDHFKSFNDTHGHDAGDLVLKALADLLRRLFRDTDVPCRLGGEEFAVILPKAGIERGLDRAEELRQSVEQLELRYSGETLKITISSGVSALNQHGRTLAELLETADQALYRAKDSGRNCVHLASI
jgi:diguanylate cyclase (GGDEF)-like protein/PAS domain S-box-containing protein